jgi:diadenosine tetraphosphatase ApaH/serine/threonine PP2A family protein phosphatase
MKNIRMNQRTLIVGDIHGCYEELVELLNKVNYDPLGDRLILVGDVINKGPETLKVLELLLSLPCEMIKGNHEVGFSRFCREQAFSNSTSFGKLKLKLEEDLEFWLSWIESWPSFIEEDDFLVVHGGIVPGRHPRDTPLSQLVCIRTWDGVGEQLNETFHPPWYDFYIEEKLVVYGHWAAQGLNIRKNTIGIDTGCVWGGSLTVLSLPERQVYQVVAKKAYVQI